MGYARVYKEEEIVIIEMKDLKYGQVGQIVDKDPEFQQHFGKIVIKVGHYTIFPIGGNYGDCWDMESILKVKILPPGTLIEVM